MCTHTHTLVQALAGLNANILDPGEANKCHKMLRGFF